MFFRKKQDETIYHVIYGSGPSPYNNEKYSLCAKDDDEALAKVLTYAVEQLHTGNPLQLRSLDRIEKGRHFSVDVGRERILEKYETKGIPHKYLRDEDFRRLEDRVR